MVAFGGSLRSPDFLPIPVSLGYPRILPKFHRLMIYFQLVKFSLLYLVAKKVSSETFKSIVGLVEDISTLRECVSELKSSLLWISICLGSIRFPLNKGFSYQLQLPSLVVDFLLKSLKSGMSNRKVWLLWVKCLCSSQSRKFLRWVDLSSICFRFKQVWWVRSRCM